MDSSNVYGSSEEHAAVLRTYQVIIIIINKHYHHHHHDQDGLLVINSVTRQPPTKEQLNLRPNRRLLRPETQEVQYSPGVHVYRSSYTGLCGWG